MSWPLIRLKDCCEVVGGATPNRNIETYWNSRDIPWLTPKDISKLRHPILNDAPEYISQEGYDSCSTYLLPKGSVLLTSRAPIGNVAIAGRDICTNQGFKSLVPGPDLNNRFLYHWITANSRSIAEMGRGATFKEISKAIVEEIRIPLPLLAEQKRIADILDKADGIRRKRQQAMDLAEEFLRATFLDMFGDPFNNIMGFPKMRLDSFGSVFTGNTPPRSEKKYYGDYIDWIKSNNIHESSLYVSRAKEFLSAEGAAIGRRVPSGSILVTCIAGSRDSIGNTALTDRPVAFNQQINALVPTDPNKTLFIYHQLNLHKELVRERSIGVTTRQVNKTTFSSIELLNPPEEMVVDFTRRISQLNMLFHQFKDSTRGINECFNSLQHKAFAGEL